MTAVRVLLLLAEPAALPPLLAYAQRLLAAVPAQLLVCVLPPTLAAGIEPVPGPAADELLRAPHPDSPAPQSVTWPAGLPFTAALQEILEQYRVGLLVLDAPFAHGAVPPRPVLTPALQVLLTPPCAVLLHRPGTAAPPRQVMAVGDGQPATLDWRGDSARTLLAAWRPTLHAGVSGRLPRTGLPARQPWRDLVADALPAPTVYAIPSAVRLGDAVAASRADLVLLVLRSQGSLARRMTVLLALHSPAPVLLIPAAR